MTNQALPGPGNGHYIASQVKAAEREAEWVSHAVMDAKGAMEQATSAWETYDSCKITELQVSEETRFHKFSHS